MEEKEESSERKKKETHCRNPAPCLSCPGQTQARQRASESGEGCTLPTRELWESASKQPCRADVGRWWAGCRSPRSVHGHEWKAEVHCESRMNTVSQPGSKHSTRQVDPIAEAGEDGPDRSEESLCNWDQGDSSNARAEVGTNQQRKIPLLLA